MDRTMQVAAAALSMLLSSSATAALQAPADTTLRAQVLLDRAYFSMPRPSSRLTPSLPPMSPGRSSPSRAT